MDRPADQTGGLVERFGTLWHPALRVEDVAAFLRDAGPDDRLEVLILDQRCRSRHGLPIPLAEYLQHFPDLAADPDRRRQLLDHAAALHFPFGAETREFATAAPDTAPPGAVTVNAGRPAAADATQDMPNPADLFVTQAPAGSGDADVLATVDESQWPAALGRYRVESLLGQGSFGCVYLARDAELDRPVAIKVPHRRLVRTEDDTAKYLAEARAVAMLDHPAIVPVHDVGRADDGLCYVVAKYVEGQSLAVFLELNRPSFEESAALVARLADALHHAHQRGLVHRDVKPANVLLDNEHNAYLVDFGLALREDEAGKGPVLAGTPSYMSPEQARGEGHRVDGRSDVFSLGVVLYELLTAAKPFAADSYQDLLQLIVTTDPPPPRQVEPRVPRELERICLKAMAKRAPNRYATARDFAEDLRHWLARAAHDPSGSDSRAAPAPAARVVPKGLRAFDAQDADFFLRLLPGPYDRDGLPESIRFWKARVEEWERDDPVPVGLIYGPSGCGKSSLVRAGLLPRLAANVRAVYVEATPDDTEARLLAGLRRAWPDLPAGLGLVDTIAALRRGRADGTKALIVLDQFEQWLHAHPGECDGEELVRALRHCDGRRVQCLVLVRDDFWLGVTRFLGTLEVRLVEGQNSAMVDLFDRRHARNVLAEFGRALGCLPAAGAFTADQDRFLDQSVDGLARDGKVVSVRLSLFAEMVKGKPWVPATLRAVGGAEGVGVNFLEETFAAASAPPAHRAHLAGVRAVLKALLPEPGADIKGQMRSRDELQAAAGYERSPRDFDDLMHILDQELRLVTPTDPAAEGHETRDTRHETRDTRH